jgi:hypothetical protein
MTSSGPAVPNTVYSKSSRGLSTRLMKNCASPVSRPRVDSPTEPRRFDTLLISSRIYRLSPAYSLAPGLPPCTTKLGTTRWSVRPL